MFLSSFGLEPEIMLSLCPYVEVELTVSRMQGFTNHEGIKANALDCPLITTTESIARFHYLKITNLRSKCKFN